MPLCASVPATVDTDLNLHGAYLTDLDKCMKKFNEALAATMNAYRNLLTAFDQVGQVYGNVAQTCSTEVNGPVKEFRDGMRELKDRGGFETFNQEIHDGTMAALDPIRQDLKAAMKSYKDVKARQKEYDTVRYDLDKTEKSYSKKEKPLSESKGYQKNLEKREKTKEVFEAKREAFIQEIEALQNSTDKQLMRSLNNYLHCTATFCGQLEATMSGYRTDMNNGSAQNMTSMDRLKEKAQVESSTRQAKRGSTLNSQRHSQGNSQGRAAASNASDAAGDDDDFYPKKEKHNSIDNSYPSENHNNKANESDYPTEEQQPQHQLKASESHSPETSQARKNSNSYPTEEAPQHNGNEGSGNRYPEEQPGPHMNGQNPFSLNAQ